MILAAVLKAKLTWSVWTGSKTVCGKTGQMGFGMSWIEMGEASSEHAHQKMCSIFESEPHVRPRLFCGKLFGCVGVCVGVC